MFELQIESNHDYLSFEQCEQWFYCSFALQQETGFRDDGFRGEKRGRETAKVQ